MSENNKCPKCDSPKVRSYDNTPSYHPSKEECEKSGYNFIENEFQFYMICDGCEHRYYIDAKIVIE
jgi:hypothetical protein